MSQAGSRQPVGDAQLGGQRLPEHQQARDEDKHADRGEEQEDTAPVGDGGAAKRFRHPLVGDLTVAFKCDAAGRGCGRAAPFRLVERRW